MLENKNRFISILISLFLFTTFFCLVNVDNSYAAKKGSVWFTSLLLDPTTTMQQGLTYKKKNIKPTKVKWKSSKPSIAKINKKGIIKAIKPGTAKMTAKYKGKTYKFKVVVKSPYKGGKKPAKFVTHNYFLLGYVILEWEAVPGVFGDAKYQVYVSKNGGSYKLYTTTKEWTCEFNDLEFGNKYSFKVREVLGPCRSSFTKAKTLNYNISVSCPQKPPIHFTAANTDLTLTSIDSIDIYNQLGEDNNWILVFFDASVKYTKLPDGFNDELYVYMYDKNGNEVAKEKFHVSFRNPNDGKAGASFFLTANYLGGTYTLIVGN